MKILNFSKKNDNTPEVKKVLKTIGDGCRDIIMLQTKLTTRVPSYMMRNK